VGSIGGRGFRKEERTGINRIEVPKEFSYNQWKKGKAG
jgi:hypothetical protein